MSKNNDTYEFVQRPQGKILADYFRSWGRVEFIMGPLGSSKTITSCQKIMANMCGQKPNPDGIRPTRWYAIRNTYSDLASTTIKDWLGLYEPLGKFTAGGIEPPTHKLHFKLDDGTFVKAELVFLALDRPDSIKKLRGAQVTGFWHNEVKELEKPIIDMADLRHGRYPSKAVGGVRPSWHGMIGDCNAADDDHWYYDLAENVKPKGWKFHRQPGGLIPKGETFVVNPLAENIHNLPDDYYLAGQEGKARDWILVNLCNEYGYVKDGKPVYPEYLDSVHCMTEFYIPDPSLEIGLGFDFGRTPACTFFQINPDMNRYIAFDELVSDDMSAATFGPTLKQYITNTYPQFTLGQAYGDPSGGNRGQATDDDPLRIMGNSGFHIIPTWTNKPVIRRASLTNPLKRLCMDGKPAFMVSPKCRTLRKGLAGAFCYKRVQARGTERYHDEPDKNMFSHVCFVAGTGISTIGGIKPVEALKKGDSVLTPIGSRRTVFTGHRESSVMTLEFSNGTSVTCTPDHPFWTNRGFVPAEALEYSDMLTEELISCLNIQSWLKHYEQTINTQSTNLKVSGITRNRPAAILNHMAGAAANSYTGRLIKRLMERLVKDLKFTIKTITPKTTIQTTLKPCLSANITDSTCLSQDGSNNQNKTCISPSKPQLNGEDKTLIKPKPLESLVEKALFVKERTLQKWNALVVAAKKYLNDIRGTCRSLIFAPDIASLSTELNQVLTTKHDLAPSVLEISEPTNTKNEKPVRLIARKLCEDKQLVYNIEVEDAHCYFANGLLVSNCESAEYFLVGVGEGREAIKRSGGSFKAAVTMPSTFNVFE